ncbi:MAG: thymidine phosphorylase [Pontiellaceae bacterium]|nr:thymidine phosphorylase [Pontiellaceae bacterium]MBN2783458.1 thymidine phosphorylase [Pontiellaceae bacterium]
MLMIMLPQWTIEKKRDGAELSTESIHGFISGYTSGAIPDYQMAALAMAIYFRGMNARETADLTLAMMHSGKIIPPESIPGAKVDKHSTGGIGDKISIPLAPLAAACGAVVPMISGRGLGITGGTLDKLESIPGYRVNLSETEFLQVLTACGCSMIGQTDEIAPADRKLYALRDVTATVPSIPLIASSILSKKMAEGIDALVLDVKCGSGAFMKTIEHARLLAKGLVDTGRSMGKKVTALITDMNQPLGRNVGNALEIRESIDILSGKGPDDVRHLTCALAGQMLAVSQLYPPAEGLEAKLADGSALNKFRQMTKLHGGELDAALPTSERQITLPAPKSGYLAKADAEAIGRACQLLGAGRTKTGDAVDHAVGISDLKKIGERIEKDEPLCVIHANRQDHEAEIFDLLQWAFDISDHQIEPSPLIIETIT